VSYRILNLDVLAGLASLSDESVQVCVTSPPYYSLRDYGVAGQIGLEPTLDAYVAKMVQVFREVKRVLRADGTLWLNLGDSYFGGGRGGNPPQACHQKQKTNRGTVDMPGKATPTPGLKPKDLMMVPARVVLALQQDGWYLRSDIIWAKPNPMPESCRDRPTSSYEHVFLLTKSKTYHYDQYATREAAQDWGKRDRSNGKYTSGDVPIAGGPHHGLRDGDFNESGRNSRNVWTIPSFAFSEAHFATFPPELVRRCLLAGLSKQGSCAKCGKGWERIIEKKLATMNIRVGEELNGEVRSLGFRPACGCDAGTVPPVVLD